MAVVNASIRGGIRGTVMPLLLDLARKPELLARQIGAEPRQPAQPGARSERAAPVLLHDAAQRADMVEYLRSASTTGP
jgi:hypothetical protein